MPSVGYWAQFRACWGSDPLTGPSSSFRCPDVRCRDPVDAWSAGLDAGFDAICHDIGQRIGSDGPEVWLTSVFAGDIDFNP